MLDFFLPHQPVAIQPDGYAAVRLAGQLSQHGAEQFIGRLEPSGGLGIAYLTDRFRPGLDFFAHLMRAIQD